MTRFQLSIIGICCLALPLFAAPNFKATIDHKVVKQGGSIKVDIVSTRPIKQGTIYVDKKAFSIFKNARKKNTKKKHHYISYLGISRYKNVGKYPSKISILYPSKKRITKRFTITVKDGEFRKSNVTLTGKKKKLANNITQLSREAVVVNKKMKTITRHPRFENAFMWPTKGTFTTPFGAYRSYNNGKRGRKHSGTDIANVSGTPIKASNHGKVILSRSFRSHGDTIMLDHGYGIVTIYNHLLSRDVQEGDIVQQGDVIGKMGSTGISTGPHLHWGMSIQNVRVNPNYWVDNAKLL